MSTGLIEPEGDDEILDFEPEALRFNAVMTGDVFEAVSVVGEPQPLTVMVAGHPCTIRGAGGQLRPRVACVRVTPHQAVPYRAWPTRFFNVFPVPEPVGLSTVAADLMEWITVDGSELRRDRRKLTLSERGIVVLQQRIVFSLTRVAVDPIRIEEASRHVVREAELERDWVEDLDATKPLEELVADFAAFMDAEGRREGLKDPTTEAVVRRAVRTRIRELRS